MSDGGGAGPEPEAPKRPRHPSPGPRFLPAPAAVLRGEEHVAGAREGTPP